MGKEQNRPVDLAFSASRTQEMEYCPPYRCPTCSAGFGCDFRPKCAIFNSFHVAQYVFISCFGLKRRRLKYHERLSRARTEIPIKVTTKTLRVEKEDCGAGYSGFSAAGGKFIL